MATINVESILNYCVHQSKVYDYERYVCNLLAPKIVKAPIFTLQAFNILLNQIVENTSNKDLANIRYTFWNETIKNLSARSPPPVNPVAQSLFYFIPKDEENTNLLGAMINARKDTNNLSFVTLDNYLKYHRSIQLPLYQIPLKMLKCDTKESLMLSNHVCDAIGQVNLIRSIPFHTIQNNVLLPNEILLKHNLASNDVLSVWRNKDRLLTPLKKKLDNFNSLLREVCGNITTNLQETRTLKHTIPNPYISLFLMTTIADIFLERCRKLNYNFLKILRLYEYRGTNPTIHRDRNILPLRLFYRKIFYII